MLGSRVYVRRRGRDPEDLVGVVSLELCGIGDSLALWDVTPALEGTPLVRAWIAPRRPSAIVETRRITSPSPCRSSGATTGRSSTGASRASA